MTKKSELQQSVEIDRKAAAFGIDWLNYDRVINNLVSECEEIREAIVNKETPERIQEEIGDLLFGIGSLCRFMNIDIEQTCKKANKKISARMKSVRELTKKRGLKNLKGQPYSLLIELWNETKAAHNNTANTKPRS
jgi:uncharacterized protein YabN with tetrapyrrole methylase and pyrophosphatase domain